MGNIKKIDTKQVLELQDRLNSLKIFVGDSILETRTGHKFFAIAGSFYHRNKMQIDTGAMVGFNYKRIKMLLTEKTLKQWK